MLKSFKVNNYKNFEKDLVIDFSNVNGYKFSNECITDNYIGKMIIYGRNATGKTNLGKAMCDLHNTLIPSLFIMNRDYTIKNANSINDITTFSYSFEFKKKTESVEFIYSKLSSKKLKIEKLIVNNDLWYQFDHEKNVFLDFNDEKLDGISKERFLQNYTVNNSLPFLTWLNANASIHNDSCIFKIYEFASNMVMVNNPYSNRNYFGSDVIEQIEKNIHELEDFFCEMGLNCKLKISKLPDGQKELYFQFDKSLVPFIDNASSGTLSLFNFYVRFIMNNRNCSLLYFDEFDAFFHYEMAQNILEYLKFRFSESLVILTTHNTNHMSNRIMRPDCLFILGADSNLCALCNATERELREGHNLQKLYMNGEFDKNE